MTGPTKPQGDFCLTPGFTACDKRAEWCGWRGGGPLLPLPHSQSPETHSLSLFNMHASNTLAPSSPIVPFCAARCRLGEDRLPKRTRRRVRSQGAGVRATQVLRGRFLLTPWGPENRKRRAPGPPPWFLAARAHTQIASLRAWPPSQTRPQSTHSVEACENLDFESRLFPPRRLGGSYDQSWPPRSPRARNGVLGLCLKPPVNSIP